METSWTLHLENFGHIESADIRMKPLMFFVGDNNSGKSYLASLVWGIMDQETRNGLRDDALISN